VSKGAFYYHFTNKESLLTQCYDFSLDQLEALSEEITAKNMGPAEKLDEACRRIFGIQNSDLGPLIRYNTITALPPPIRRRILARTDTANSFIHRFIEQGQQEGSMRAVNIDVTALLMRQWTSGAGASLTILMLPLSITSTCSSLALPKPKTPRLAGDPWWIVFKTLLT
jgi:AcrR family transcriptional regulator